MIRFWISVLLMAAFGAGFAAAQGPQAGARSKISPMIRQHQLDKSPQPGMSSAEHRRQLERRGMNADDLTGEDCALYVERPLAQMEIVRLGAQSVAIHGSYVPPVLGKHLNGYYLATVPYSRLDFIDADARFQRLETTEIAAKPLNDLAMIQSHVLEVHNGTGVAPRTGAGVKLAIADSGLDLSHPDIPAPVEAYDMTKGTDIATWGTTVANTVTPHGTHVVGIAVGSGAASSGKYQGVAPGASLYFYKIGSDSTSSASQTDEIEAIQRALAVGCKVFSMSYGGLDDFMDGSDSVSQAIDAATAAGMTCFISAGNSATDAAHYSTTVAPLTTSSSFGYQLNSGEVTNGTNLFLRVIWRDGNPGDANVNLACTNLSGGESLNLSAIENSPRGTDAKYYRLKTNQTTGATKTYDFTLTNTAPSGATPKVHVYAEDSGAKFTSPDPTGTVLAPALADSAIAVAAWTSRKDWTNYLGGSWQFPDLTVDTLAPFSSLGPRIDGVRKPDVAAPGAAIIAARDSVSGLAAADAQIIDNDGLNLDGSGPAQYYILEGTSMAAPHAAGIAALVLEAQPTLTPAQLRQALTSTAAHAGAPDSNSGYGLLNALAAVQADVTPPEIQSITARTPGPTNADSIIYDVTFSESVVGVAAGDFAVTTVSGDAAGDVNPTVGGSGADWTVTVQNVAGDGELELDLTNSAGIADSAGNARATGSFFGSLVWIDNTPPSVVITSTASDPTSLTLIPVSVSFSEPVTGFALGGVTPGNALAQDFSGASDTYSFSLAPLAAGSVTADIPAGVAFDAAGNPNLPAVQFSRQYIPSNMLLWIDFAWSGAETGESATPYQTLAAGVAHAGPGGTLKIKGDTAINWTAETPRLTQAVRIEAVNGPVRIGGAP